MKTLGILGGTSWVSTVEYYRLLNEGVQKSLGGVHSAHLMVSSVEFQEYSDWMAAGDWAAVERGLRVEAKRLAAGGADAILIASNTMHACADAVQEAAGVPVLHIADSVGKRISGRGIRTIGLMGTRYAMEKEFYRVRLRERFGIESLIPPEDERTAINRIIFDELCREKFLEESRAFVLGAAARLIARGAQGIVLGCTELPLIVHDHDLAVARFDTMAAHAEDGVRFLLG
jgi:aspartate racemase